MTLVSKVFAVLVVGVLMMLGSMEANAQAARGFPDARMRDFERQRACELNLPTCLPQIRRQMEQREVDQMWQSAMIVGVLVLVGLLVVRANNKKKIEDQQMVARSRQAARQRKQRAESGESEEEPEGVPKRSTLERPPGFGRR